MESIGHDASQESKKLINTALGTTSYHRLRRNSMISAAWTDQIAFF